jgi:hypothetical protein
MPAAWCPASPEIGEREAAAELLAHAARTCALRPGLILIGDRCFAGHQFEDLVTTGFGLAAADRRTWLIITVHAQLRLARPLAADLRHPWERPAPPGRLTPARVRRGV